MPEGQSYRKKLIEVALPLEDINRESAREKSIRHGHPSTLHLWWARRPLAACRAVLFAQMVDDPSSLPEDFPTEAAQEAERERLFDIIREMVKWENTTNEQVLHAARVEIARSAARNHGVSLPREMTPAEVADALKQYAPPVLDPFAGGGSIPLEAQRLGLEAHASDLNPVPVLINKALIEIPPKFAGRPPVNPDSRKRYLQKEWKGAEGLAEDVRYYGKWMRDEAIKRIGHLYPKVRLPRDQGGGEAPVIAWLWARTVKCPNPACGARMPLVKSFRLSARKGGEASIQPIIDRDHGTISYRVQSGKDVTPSTVNRTGATCIVCGSAVPFPYIREEGKARRIGEELMALVAEGRGGRIFLPPPDAPIGGANSAAVSWVPDTDLPDEALGFRVQLYGLKRHSDLFTARQLATLDTLACLVLEVRDRLSTELDGDIQYASAVATYLGLGVSRMADLNNNLCQWRSDAGKLHVGHPFTRSAISMTWDFAEANPFGPSAGGWDKTFDFVPKVLDMLPLDAIPGHAVQRDATSPISGNLHPMISTDPPYYDNVPYADLSDFFYVWLRRSLGTIYPDLFGTLLVPKAAELVADPFRHSGRDGARQFFERGLGNAFSRMRDAENAAYPLSVYYAFKQAESADDDEDAREGGKNGNGSAVVASTGWVTMLEGLLRAGFSTHGTWPVRSELGNRMRSIDSNALASSIVLVCRPRPETAERTDRRGFLNALHRELPSALRDLQRGNIAPVDLAQAAIGPGMAVFSRYSKVIEADGSAMRVRTALQLINQTLDEVLAEQEGQFDADTRFAVAWFEQYGMGQGKFGEADVLARAKNTSVGGLDEAGILEARGGNVRLLRRDELPDAWNPHQDHRLSVWKATQHLIHAVMEGGGAQAAAAVLDAVGSDYGEKARDLAYRLYVTSERKKWTQDAFAYNTLVTEWHDIAGGAEGIRERAIERERATVRQATLIEE